MVDYMLDFRINTFLAVCRYMSFSQAAEALHITQPAVSQHMQVLQDKLGQQLYVLHGRQVVLTEQGRRYYEFAQSLDRDIKRFTSEFATETISPSITFGATLSIGEFILPPLLSRLTDADPQRNITLYVDNTENLLGMLDEGTIDVAFIEGAFDKNSYDYRLWSHERFIGIGSQACLERHTEPTLEMLLEERLIIRERGSGTRGVLERYLAESGLTPESFSHVDEIGNLNVIKYLVSRDHGISFLYEAAARDAIEQENITELPIKEWQVSREFNFVFTKNSQYTPRFLDFYRECKRAAVITEDP